MTTDLNDLRAQVAAIRATQISTARGSGANDASRPPQGANPSSARQNNAGRGRGGSSVGAGGQPPGPARSQRESAMRLQNIDSHHLST